MQKYGLYCLTVHKSQYVNALYLKQQNLKY